MRGPIQRLAAFSTMYLTVAAGPVLAQSILSPPPVTAPTYIAPPPPTQEFITAAPSPAYVWVAGRWERTADSWSWKPGEWVEPPFSNAYWVPGYWQHQGGQYMWETAHWAAAQQGLVVQKPITAPPVYEEMQPPAPVMTGYVWQPGYWDWRGTWLWVPGAYIETTTPSAIWVQGEWEATVEGSWRWNPAHWEVE